MPSLTPVTEGAQTLAPHAEGAETLAALAEGSESLTVSLPLVFHYQYLWPSALTYPSSSTWPGLYGDTYGGRLTTRSEDTKTLTPLQEA